MKLKQTINGDGSLPNTLVKTAIKSAELFLRLERTNRQKFEKLLLLVLLRY